MVAAAAAVMAQLKLVVVEAESGRGGEAGDGGDDGGTCAAKVLEGPRAVGWGKLWL